MNTFARNLHLAVRLLWKSPTFTLTAVLCLGLAIGANTTLFGILDSLLWKPLPVERPDRLVRVFARPQGSNPGRLYRGFSYPEFVDYRDGNGVLSGLAATVGVQLGFRDGGHEAIRVFGEAVSDNYFEMLGVRASRGRVLAPGRGGRLNTVPEVVLSHRQMAKVLFLPQAMTALAGPAAGLAVLIAAIGLYGVVAFLVSLRTREFGIRFAIGAQPQDVIRYVMSQGLGVVGVGLGIGGAVALALAQVVAGVLVGVRATDPLAFGGATGLLVGIAVLAIYLPARRAGRVDPLAVLRQE